MSQLEEGLSSASAKNPKPLSLTELKSGAGAGYESCKELLILIGFKVEEAGDGSATFSKDSSIGVLHCCTALAEAVVGELCADLNGHNQCFRPQTQKLEPPCTA